MEQAQKLPLELKMEVLLNLPYSDIHWISSSYFWIEYWKRYNLSHPISDVFQPNPEQNHVLQLVECGRNVFVNAPAGTGKSALVKHLKKTAQHKNIGVTSTTGISALNIEGSTLHSFLGIGLGIDHIDDLYDKIIRNTAKRELWLKLNILVIDEVSMLHPTLFDKLEKLARRIRNNKRRFGGIQLLVTGDLFQLPPVSQQSTLVVSSTKFRKCIDETVELRNIIRQLDQPFKNMLNKVRVGNINDQVKDMLISRFLKPPKTLIKPTKLFCTRKSVDHLNERELDKLASCGFEFRAYIMDFINQECPVSFEYVTKNFIKNSTTPETLCLAEQAQVMLTYNISPTLVNGSRGVVVGFSEQNYPIVEFLDKKVEVIKPIRFNLHHTLNNGKIKFVGYAIQVPLKIAYALTIHACQGCTIDCAAIDLGETFEYGQAYTALSRVRSLDGLYLKKFNFDLIQAHPEAIAFSTF
jgi:ATP-dependent DNA helicase PIF1